MTEELEKLEKQLEVLHIQKIPNQKEFDAREAAWKVYARTSAFLHDTAVRMDVCVRMIRDPPSCEENEAVLVKHMLGKLIAIKTDADEQVPERYRPVLNGIYQYFLNEVLWYSKVDEMVYPLQYEYIKRACKEDHETAEEPSSEVQYEEEKKTQHSIYTCRFDRNVKCDKTYEDGTLLRDVCEKCEHHKADEVEALEKRLWAKEVNL